MSCGLWVWGRGIWDAGKARRRGTHFLLIGFSSWPLGADASGEGVDVGDIDSRSLFVRATGISYAAAAAAQSSSSLLNARACARARARQTPAKLGHARVYLETRVSQVKLEECGASWGAVGTVSERERRFILGTVLAGVASERGRFSSTTTRTD